MSNENDGSSKNLIDQFNEINNKEISDIILNNKKSDNFIEKEKNSKKVPEIK